MNINSNKLFKYKQIRQHKVAELYTLNTIYRAKQFFKDFTRIFFKIECNIFLYLFYEYLRDLNYNLKHKNIINQTILIFICLLPFAEYFTYRRIN